MLTVYTKPMCPECDKAKFLLDGQGIDYQSVVVDADSRDFLVSQGIRSVPAIFDGETYMGGLRELRDFVTTSS